ncbi:unnamed protein product [Nippostrongylus brasiliensis]|uniref:PiggyBac transposable element-derived protein 4 (inferred by orthology to a human protein) n=1 Tax=Nippostrongylus brasiliensis TaxID=27835 RepID=A0A0N4Y481_NIPBR|nr:unnamed protein product [Nippostrongylus brasiliensis]
MNLVDGLLDQGRTLFTDNWYTSVDLAEVLLKRSTNMVGTIRRNRVGIPKEIKNRKLKRGEMVAVQNRKGVVIIRWRDKRELFMLSTMHGDSRSERTDKPTIVHAYNEGKTFVDTSDQMASYSPFVRRTCKWYIRLFFHLLTQTALVNAWKLYCATKERIGLTKFKILITREWLSRVEPDQQAPHGLNRETDHRLEKVGFSRNSRKRCVGCYQDLAMREDSATAGKRAKRVNTRCTKCQKTFCVSCFSAKHKKCS